MRSADTRHRGPHPADPRLFAPQQVPGLRRAVAELSWLLTRGYPPSATLKLVGDRYALLGTAASKAWRCQRPSRAGEMPWHGPRRFAGHRPLLGGRTRL